MYWQNPQRSSLRMHLCASERSERAIFGVFNSFTVKKVNFYTINVILSSKSGGGGDICTGHPPHPKKWGGGGGGYIPPPGYTPVHPLHARSFPNFYVWVPPSY